MRTVLPLSLLAATIVILMICIPSLPVVHGPHCKDPSVPEGQDISLAAFPTLLGTQEEPGKYLLEEIDGGVKKESGFEPWSAQESSAPIHANIRPP